MQVGPGLFREVGRERLQLLLGVVRHDRRHRVVCAPTGSVVAKLDIEVVELLADDDRRFGHGGDAVGAMADRADGFRLRRGIELLGAKRRSR